MRSILTSSLFDLSGVMMYLPGLKLFSRPARCATFSKDAISCTAVATESSICLYVACSGIYTVVLETTLLLLSLRYLGTNMAAAPQTAPTSMRKITFFICYLILILLPILSSPALSPGLSSIILFTDVPFLRANEYNVSPLLIVCHIAGVSSCSSAGLFEVP